MKNGANGMKSAPCERVFALSAERGAVNDSQSRGDTAPRSKSRPLASRKSKIYCQPPLIAPATADSGSCVAGTARLSSANSTLGCRTNRLGWMPERRQLPLGHRSHRCFMNPQFALYNTTLLPEQSTTGARMADERSGISLRSGPKRKGRPTISAPRQLSGPPPNDGADIPRSLAVGRPAAGTTTPTPRARLPPQTGGKVRSVECGRLPPGDRPNPVLLDLGPCQAEILDPVHDCPRTLPRRSRHCRPSTATNRPGIAGKEAGLRRRPVERGPSR